MGEMIMAAYEFATAFVPFLVAYAAVRAWARRSGRVAVGPVPALAFVLYVTAVLYVTGIGTVHDIGNVLDGAHPAVTHVNLHPFWGGVSLGAVLNAVMFVPLGVLLPLIWRRAARLLPTVALGFAFSLAIELSQLLNNRTTDIDDLVTNTLGTLAGFVLFKLWECAASRTEDRARHMAYPGNLWSGGREVLRGLAEPALYLAVMFVGHFLLYDGLEAGKLLFGS